MIAHQILRRLEKVEALTAAHNHRLQITLWFVHSDGDGQPSGRVDVADYSGGVLRDLGTIEVDPQLLAAGGRGWAESARKAVAAGRKNHE